MSNVVNIIFAKNPGGKETEILDAIRNNFNTFGLFKVGEISIARTRDEVTSLVETQKYQAVVCMETLNNETVGGGFIRKWLKENITVILFVGDEKYSQDKMFFLYDSGYYDALFLRDFQDGREIANLIKSSRTSNEAVKYYGLKDNEKYKEKYMTVHKEEPEEENIAVAATPTEATDNIDPEDISKDIGNIFGNSQEQEQEATSLGQFSYSSDEPFYNEPSSSNNENITTPVTTPVNESIISHDMQQKQQYTQPTYNEPMNNSNTYKTNNFQNNANGGFFEMEQNFGNMQYRNQEYTNVPMNTGYNQQNQQVMPEVKMSTQPATVTKAFSIEPYQGVVVAPVSPTAVIIEIPGVDFFSANKIDRGTQISLLIPTTK